MARASLKLGSYHGRTARSVGRIHPALDAYLERYETELRRLLTEIKSTPRLRATRRSGWKAYRSGHTRKQNNGR